MSNSLEEVAGCLAGVLGISLGCVWQLAAAALTVFIGSCVLNTLFG